MRLHQRNFAFHAFKLTKKSKLRRLETPSLRSNSSSNFSIKFIDLFTVLVLGAATIISLGCASAKLVGAHDMSVNCACADKSRTRRDLLKD